MLGFFLYVFFWDFILAAISRIRSFFGRLVGNA